MIDRRAFYEQRAALRPRETERYYSVPAQLFHLCCSPGLRVLEVGCGLGDLLAALNRPGAWALISARR